jgi:hypothetical protein
MRLDTSAERKIEQILATPDAPRIRQLAGLNAPAGMLADTQLLRETARAATRYEFRATLTARPDASAPSGWQLEIPTRTAQPQTPLPDGAPLSHHTARRLLDITRESDLAALRRHIAQNNDTLRRLEQARDRHQAELAAGTAPTTTTSQPLVATGTVAITSRLSPDATPTGGLPNTKDARLTSVPGATTSATTSATLATTTDRLHNATLPLADEQHLAQVATQKTGDQHQIEIQTHLHHIAANPDLDTLPQADGAYLWRAGLWLPLPRNDARITRSTLRNILGAVLPRDKTRQDIGTLAFEGTVQPPIAFITAPIQTPVILAYRGPMKIYAGVPAGRIPIEVAPLKSTNTARRRAAKLERAGASAATFGAAAGPATVTQPRAPRTNIYLVRVTQPLSPGRHVLAAPDQPFEFEVRWDWESGTEAPRSKTPPGSPEHEGR